MKTRYTLALCALMSLGCSTEGPAATPGDSPDAVFEPTSDAPPATPDAPPDAPEPPADGLTDAAEEVGPTPVTCGDGLCAVGESFETCPEDCTPVCGDIVCTGDESSQTCPEDCGAACGDGVCNGGEDSATCASDCGPTCGDGACNGNETPAACPADCGAACGDAVCNGDETTVTCPADCGALCPDGVCNGDETSAACPEDCGTTCGDGSCNGGETSLTCPADCGASCGDGACNGAESSSDCPADCGSACGDGACNGGETTATCAADCGESCGDGACSGGESTLSCPEDCGSSCGDGACNEDETTATCSADCGESCGDGVCGEGEDCLSCGGDCACDCTELCLDASCVVDPCAPCGPPPVAEVCDDEDNDCDGAVDEDFANFCDDKACGDDGCGGSCGSCAPDEVCADGVCLCVEGCGEGPAISEFWTASCAEPPCVQGYGAELVGLSFPPALEQGAVGAATFQLVNVGTETWAPGVVALGAVDDQDPLSGDIRVTLGAAAATGDVASFTVTLQAPTLAAPRRVHNLYSDWRLVAEGGVGWWFGPTVGRWVSVYDASPVPTDSLVGKVLAGYQGWFATPDGPAPAGWRHWCQAGTTPTPSTVTFDLWPDLREWPDAELTPSGFMYPDGTAAGLYTAYHFESVERHVRWMKEYGLDGVWLQRFASELGDPVFKDFRDTVAQHIGAAAQVHGRVFAIMYDISGMTESPSMFEQIVDDWKHLVDTVGVTESSRYMHHGGRPVLGIWGLGFNDRPGDAASDQSIIEHLQNGIEPAYRVTVLGGVPDGWRTSSESSKPNYGDVYGAYDLLSPWTVGRYGSGGYPGFQSSHIVPDLAQQGANAYIPVIWPGFSWQNLQVNQNGGTAPLNQFPRLGGEFLWDQAWGAYSAGATMGYIAMFDEVDESTAIFKAAEDATRVPTTGTFLTLGADGYALPSDWYLRLAGEVVNLFRGVYGNQPDLPLDPSSDGGVVVPPECGNGSCAPGVEDCGSCPGDCPCPPNMVCEAGQCVDDGGGDPPECGNGSCTPGLEDCARCPGDCPCPPNTVCEASQCVDDGGGDPPECGNGSCAPGVEDCGSCPGDCPCPPDTICDKSQCVDPDAQPGCGDGSCEPGVEDCGLCPADCPCAEPEVCVGNQCVEPG